MPSVSEAELDRMFGWVPKSHDGQPRAAGVAWESCSEQDPDAPVDQTVKREFRYFERRFGDNGEHYCLERKAFTMEVKKDWWLKYAFCVIWDYDVEDNLIASYLYVNSQPLRQLLKDVIGKYPPDPINVNDVQIKSPYYSLFYYRKELESEGTNRFRTDEESRAQLNMLMNWINAHFTSTISAYDRCISGDIKSISHDNLWTVFRPEQIIHATILDQHRAFRVVYCWYDKSDMPCFYVQSEFIDSDGEKFGLRIYTHTIENYPGMRKLSELAVMPLDLLDDADEVRTKLIARGRKFESYIGPHFEQYDGIAVKKNGSDYYNTNIIGRIMIDCKTYHRLQANDSFNVDKLNNKSSTIYDNESVTGIKSFNKLSDDNALLANARVRGFAFDEKRFLEFFVDAISPIQWNSRCFDDIVLDPEIKRTIQALVSTHSSQTEGFTDIIEGKGQGLVFVLHGPPGVGKTLTAECVAEYVRRPLFMVSFAELGTDIGGLHEALASFMDLATTWKAILLIDEADIFLESRSFYDVHRNAMVSVFLRALDYYAGMIFLTTNRVNTFDDAFKSRIHIPLRYTDLSQDSRLQIWRNCCGRVPGGVDIDEAGLAKLAEYKLNGRQIKNAILSAQSLAAFDGVRVDLDQLQRITKIQATFEKDLSTFGGADYTAPGEVEDTDKQMMFF
ncbi:P-loop containing nucleoside triphosphate hydrolase protein [Whalleya microplaca]|nr:P-loop containing nucleoside triphosphate hydrolase protein [Whalleya microplaca]